MNNFNIDIISNVLSETIQKLKIDNDNITKKMQEIFENINILTDDNVWKSPEKSVILDELLPFLENSNNDVQSELNNCVFTLEKALNKYLETNKGLEKNADDLAS